MLVKKSAEDIQRTAKYSLEALSVFEVSVVDRGANLRPLLLVKNEGGEAAPKTETPPGMMTSLPDEIREEVSEMLASVSVRVSALGEAVKAATPGDGVISEKFQEEVLGLSAALRRLASVDKGINALDKAALEAGEPIERAGVRPAFDKKSPIEYVMTEDGPAMKLPPEHMLDIAITAAVHCLFDAEDMLLFSADVDGACAKLRDGVAALGPFAKSAQEATDKADGDAKRGTDLSRVDELLSAFHKLLTETRPIPPVEKPHEAVETTKDAEINADPAPDVISPQVQSALTKMAGMISSLQTENTLLKQSQSKRPLGNAAVPSGTTTTNARPKVYWPDDLNDLVDSDPT